MTPTIVSLRRHFTVLVAVLGLIGLAQLITGQVLLSRLQERSTGIGQAQEANQAMLASMVSAETGVRGYQLTGDPVFLEPYNNALVSYPLAMQRVRDADTSHELEVLVDEQNTAAQRWLREFAAPIAATPSGRPGLDRDGSLRGKALFDAYRDTNDATTTALAARDRELISRFRSEGLPVGGLLALLALAAVAVALRLAVRTHRLLLAPLARLQDVLTRLTGGDRDARAELTGPPEVRHLAIALNTALDHQQQAETRLRAAHDELAAERAYLAEILDLLPVAVLTCTADGTIRHLNRAALAPAHGTTPPARVTGLVPITEPGVAPGPDTEHPLARALAGETLNHREMEMHTADGTTMAIVVDARALRDRDGVVTGAIATGFDVTALRDREAELTAFAGVVAHDLRAPLANVAGYADLLNQELPPDGRPIDPEPIRPMVVRIGNGLGRMSALIDDLLAYATARDAPLCLELVDLHTMIDDVVAERTNHLTPGQSVPHIEVGDLPDVRGDRRMLRQVFDNLIGNAIKYTRSGTVAEVEITGHPGDDRAWITIADHGIGIPADEHADVFTSFHRARTSRQYTGTGLGLAICQRVVQRHAGTIAVKDNPGGGTRVSLSLPLASDTRP